jgi:hypothetical protein
VAVKEECRAERTSGVVFRHKKDTQALLKPVQHELRSFYG